MPERPRIARLDEIEARPGPGTLTWRPVRLALGIRAFGTNAYTAAEAGVDVVEPHTENPKLAHEELYFVAAGRATFTIDGESYDAPSGTYVFIPDPASHRHAVSAEPGTTVLSFGGPPTFVPSAWEWYMRAGPLIRTEPEKAREILLEGLRLHPDDGGTYYNLACLEAVRGNRSQALASLRKAVALRPETAAWAPGDEDFRDFWGDPEFVLIVGS
ncbi:MAG TPA: AraC family ligand binding domain-containing protein [Solirubrobacteraceae bacterium]|jgi:tetratricopeptide (TPR) repeat protein